MHGIRLTTYEKKMPNRKPVTVNTSNVHTYQLRHLYASLGVLLKAEPKALQVLMGHAKIKTTMDIYAQAQDELQRETAETIDDFITSLTLENSSEDMEELFKNIQSLNLYTSQEREIKYYKQELIRLVNIQKLEEQIKNIILRISNIEDTNKDNQTRLKLIYSLLSNMEEFKTQTRNIKRNTNKCNDDYKYIFNYLQITQYLLKSIDKAKEYKPTKQPATIKNFAVNY